MPGLHVTTVGPWGLREAIGRALSAGGVAEALFAAGGAGDVREVRCVVALPDGALLIRCPLPAGVAPSVVDLVPAPHLPHVFSTSVHLRSVGGSNWCSHVVGDSSDN